MAALVRQFVLKVHSRCDLSCDHCYVYEHADQSWQVKPRALAGATARQAAARIAEHARRHRLDEVYVVLHGGEPLLLGHQGLHGLLACLRSTIGSVARLDLRIQTNGVLLDERLCALFDGFGVKVGVSLDGDRSANDRHRRFPDGRSSHEQVSRALSLLRRDEYRHLYAGILCTVDVANDPIAVYEALLAEAPPQFDLLLPHATWDRPPPRPDGAGTPYAEWLAAVHGRWVADGRPVPIRFFDSLRSAWQGQPSSSEAAGLDPVDLLVIDTDGSWEQADSLKTAFDGAPATGMNVYTHSVDEAAAHPGVAARMAGLSALCDVCRGCHLVRACGGGLYAHRHRSGSGYSNPSVYCEDLKVLIPRVTGAPKRGRPVLPAAQPPSLPASQPLPAGTLDLLAAGPGSAAAMTALLDRRWSVSRALIAAAASGFARDGGDLGRAAAAGWALLSELDARWPAAVREVLTYPFAQAWAVRCLTPEASELDRAHVACLAAAAALRAGVEVELALPIRDGAVYLPTAGALAVDGDAGPTAAVRVSPARVALRGRLGPGGWRTLRRIETGGLAVAVEDIDPFRDCQGWPVTGRLTTESWRAWRQALPAAARRLASALPAYAGVLGIGLRSVVPVLPDPAGHDRSGTPRAAFGAVALALPPGIDGLSLLLLHETQHVKLGALCDLLDLFDREDGTTLQVGWRPDPRPTEGALQGTYAHLALAAWWRVRGQRDRRRGAAGGESRRLFHLYRSWVAEAIEALMKVGTLTPEGERFVGGMRKTVEGWDDEA